MSVPSLSLVVVIHDSAPDLACLLASVEQHLAPTPQLVVVDSGSSSPAGVELARTAGAIVIELPGNLGFGAANNAGVARATGEVCALLNPDVELLDDGLGTLAGRAAGRRQLLVPRLHNADGSLQRSAHPLPGRAGGLLPAALPAALLPRSILERAEPWRGDRVTSVGWAIAACVVAPTSLLRRLGPFDPETFLFYEDLDLCLRARAEGVPTVLNPDVALRHQGAHSTRTAYAGEPHELLARRRREVVGARLGRGALALDDGAQALTFATRAAGRTLLGRNASRERAQLAAVRAARRW
ncbi:MAG: glycosyltransferase family 2 protein [Solirubrobacteraceae bacterium]